MSLNDYESHNLVSLEDGKNINIADWYDDDGFLKIRTFVDADTLIPFAGEYLYINRADENKKFYGSFIYNLVEGKINGKASEFNEFGQRYYRGEFKNGMEHGFFESIFYEDNSQSKIEFTEKGQYNRNKKDDVWELFENGQKHIKIWNNGILQSQ